MSEYKPSILIFLKKGGAFLIRQQLSLVNLKNGHHLGMCFFRNINQHSFFCRTKLINHYVLFQHRKLSPDFKKIHIGNIIKQSVLENKLDDFRICNFMQCTQDVINEMYEKESLDADVLLRWSKLLKYDFFRIYSQHLILYSPPSKASSEQQQKSSFLPLFRKNIYTKEVIDFILNQIDSQQMSKLEVIEQYNIPKTTLYKWIRKYRG